MAAGLAGSTSALVDDWLYCGLFLLAAASCAARAGEEMRGPGRSRRSAWSCGGRRRSCIAYRFPIRGPVSRGTQILLFLAFAFAYTTLGLLARERVRHFDAVLVLDGLLAGLAAAAVAAVSLFPSDGAPPLQGPAAPPQVFLIGALSV